ncbi:MAG: hypothetical protein ABJA67_10715 [Chthonomonadales bacterium]
MADHNVGLERRDVVGPVAALRVDQVFPMNVRQEPKSEDARMSAQIQAA